MKIRTRDSNTQVRNILVGAALVGGTAAIINQVIFARAEKRRTKTPHAANYDWRYGRIHYVAVGKGDALLFVHDTRLGSGLAEWQPLIEWLSQHYRVYAIDLLGFGESEKPALTYSAYLYTTLINDFIADVIGQPVYFAGVGATAAIGAMARCFQPALYRKMLLISPDGQPADARNTSQARGITGKWMKHLLDLPLVGTSVYNILASHFFLQEEARYNQAHYGGSGARFPIAALYGQYLHAELELAIAAANIPIYILSQKKHPQSNLGALYREIRECLQRTV